MKALFIKDLMLLKNQGKTYGLIIAFYVVLSVVDHSVGNFILGFLSVLLGFFAVSTISYDEYQHGMNYLMTLPISRKSYVREKYLFAFGLSSIMSILLFLAESIYRIFAVSVWTQTVLWDTASSTLLMIPITLLFLALAIPLHLKLGSERGRSMFNGLLLGIFFTSVIGLKNSVFLQKVASVTSAYGTWLVIAGILLYGFLIGLSYRISVHILEKREF